ncbi:MAG: S9 family peptidase, partial [Candidatus Methylomirabilia bacterium]
MASSARPGIIPRKTLMGNPDKISPELSPEGTRLAYIAPVDGVLNVWVGPVADPGAARPVTRDTHRGIRDYFWAFTNRHIIYTQDTHGDENWHIYSTDLETMETKDLTPIDGVAARVLAVSHHFPDEILVGLNDRDIRYHDIHRVNIRTGQRTLVQENPEYAGFVTDDDYAVRFAVRYTEDGGKEMLTKTPEGFKHYARISMDDTLTTGAVGFDGTGRVMYMIDSRGRNTAALRAVNLDTGDETVLAEDAKSDISGIQRHPTKKHVQAVTSNYTRPEWIVIDPAIADDIERLKQIAEGDVWILDRTLDDTQWLVAYIPDRGPVHYYHYDVAKKEASFLFSQREELEDMPLVPMHPVVVRSRDGLDLVCYLTLPKEADPD